ncbi:MAG: hypothetical protein HZB39_21555 [Planctomycetes bacterium]|nr:hypothetical protein [Planctomycetota bacterium]
MRSPILAAMAAVATSSLLVAQVANDECSGAVVVVDGANGPFSNVGATNSAPAFTCGAGGNDVWFVYRATCTGSLAVNTCGSGFDTVLRAFDATCTPCGSFTTAMACNDDSCGLQSAITLSGVTMGNTYYFSVGGFAGGTGAFGLNITCTGGGGGGPPDDECSGPTPISLGVNGTFTNVGYTTSSPSWPCGAGGNDRWFAFRPTCTAPHTFYTCSPNTDYDTTIEIFSGNCGCGITSLGCNDDSCGLQSSITATLTLGNVYLVRVGGFASNTGNFDLTVDVGTGTGTITAMGVGACGGITIATTGNPNINGNLTTNLGGIGAGIPVIAYGFLPQNLVFCATCALGHDWSIVIPGASFALTIPCDPTLIGANLFTQGAEIGGTGCGLFPLSMTDTEQIVIG